MNTLPAPAKINLHLHVTGRSSDGRHTLDTSFAYVDICDLLTIRPAGELRVHCSSSHLDGERNLVHRVLAAMRRYFGCHDGLEVYVEKHIPEQAGLGGGSSDAATAILAANRLWRLNLPASELIAFAAPFGADIPCFLYGRACLASGIGERLSPLAGKPPSAHIVLAHPGSGLSTASVFHAFDAAVGQLTPSMHADTMPGHPDRGDGLPFATGVNDLEPVACGLCPPLAPLLEAMREGARLAWMSGSGTACVALLDDAGEAAQLAENLKRAGLAKWAYAGRLLATHPLSDVAHWGVAKW